MIINCFAARKETKKNSPRGFSLFPCATSCVCCCRSVELANQPPKMSSAGSLDQVDPSLPAAEPLVQQAVAPEIGHNEERELEIVNQHQSDSEKGTQNEKEANGDEADEQNEEEMKDEIAGDTPSVSDKEEVESTLRQRTNATSAQEEEPAQPRGRKDSNAAAVYMGITTEGERTIPFDLFAILFF
jgi:hypothetical protein